jgi:hypothetical protein
MVGSGNDINSYEGDAMKPAAEWSGSSASAFDWEAPAEPAALVRANGAPGEVRKR